MPKKKRKTKVKKQKPRKRKTKVKKQKYQKKKIKIDENQELVIKTKPEWIKSGLVNKSSYQKKYNDSIKNNNVFWKKEGKRITWIKPYKKIKVKKLK